ncbi:MAG: HK97 gp10 family phage protein [Acidobacterium ailaaui]|jgi:HK97 gp10 family phage protein|nr:HK97 gp10 family phage protein [Pseudacidobacterium ailaaui]
MALSESFSGLEAVEQALQAALESMTEQINEAVQEAALYCQAQAKRRCPVDTGRLRSSIEYQPGYLEAQVETNVYYAPFVEYGTRKMTARPFLGPASTQASKRLQATLTRLRV